MNSTLEKGAEMTKKVGQRVRDFRTSIPQNLDQFANGLNIQRSHLWKIENGYIRISLEPLVNLHDNYGVDMNKLLTMKEEHDQLLSAMTEVRKCNDEEILELFTCIKAYLLSHNKDDLTVSNQVNNDE